MMPSSPFGLAYGLGQAFSGLPQAMNQRQNEELGLQMRGLQLQQMKRQEAQEEALQQAGQNVQPETETVLQGLGSAPEMGQVSPEAQASAKGLGLPTAAAIPNAPTDEQMASVQKPLSIVQRQKVYTTPYQAAAHRYGAMADYLFKQGMVEPAMRLQQQAQQATQLHQTTTLSQAARMASIGNYGDSVRMLNGLGMNITGMSQSPDDPESVRIQSVQNGRPVYTDIDKDYIGAMIEDPVRASQSMANLQWRMGGIASREKVAQQNIQSREKIAADRTQAQLAHYKLMEQAKAASGNLPTAMMKNAAFYAQNAGIPVSEAIKLFTPGRGKESLAPSQRISALKTANAGIKSIYGGEIPVKDSKDQKEVDDYNQYIENQKEIQRLSSGGPAPSPTPSGIPSPASKDEYDKLPSGSKYMKDGKVYIKG